MLGLAVELMNMKQQSAEVALTVTWEFILRKDNTFKPVQPYWFDIGACGSSEKPSMRDANFEYTSPVVKAPTNGVIAAAASHLHNGGTHLELLKEGKPLCTSYAHYDHDHIHELTTCYDLRYSKGDEFSIAAYYNTSKHMPMEHSGGSLEPVMGIALVYAVEDVAQSGHARRTGILIGAMCIAGGVLFSAGFYVLRNRKNSRNTVPVWLRNQYKSAKSIIAINLGADETNYEPLIGRENGEGSSS